MATATKSKLKYSWKNESRITGDPQEIGQALEELAAELGRPVDGLTADDIVDAARSPDSPLYAIVYRLDDDEAAHEHRKDIARLILRSIRVTVIQEGHERQAIAYVHVRVPDEGPMYVPTSLASRREDLRIQMLEDAQRGIDGWLGRYRNLEGAEEVFVLIEKASKAMRDRIRQAKAEKSKPALNAVEAT